MRWGLDSIVKLWKRVLPKHKHQFESLFEYKSDDEDDSDTDADSLEDKTTVTIAPFEETEGRDKQSHLCNSSESWVQDWKDVKKKKTEIMSI